MLIESATNPIFFGGVLAIAWVTAFLLTKIHTPKQEKYSSIDGLRGYLALSVFIHHSSIWFYYAQSNQWVAPPSNTYNNVGQAGVILFFMITAFLFTRKIMESDKKPIDWTYLFSSRLARLSPLYMFAVLIITIITIKHTGQLNLRPITEWLLFTIPGAPDINNFKGTTTIIAGVIWTLPYEWLFYASLPVISLIFLRPTPIFHLTVGLIAFTVISKYLDPSFDLTKPFLAGAVAATLTNTIKTHREKHPRIFDFIAVSCLAAAVTTGPTAYSDIPIMLLFISFIIVASGGTIFNLLKNQSSLLLGEISYSIYLLHGIILFAIFQTSDSSTAQNNHIHHWATVFAITPIIVIASLITYKTIELPPMKIIKKIFNPPRKTPQTQENHSQR